MKLISLALVHNNLSLPQPVILCLESDTSSFGLLERSTVKDLVVFLTRNVAKNAAVSQRQTTNHESYSIHCYALSSGLTGVAISDEEYSARAAHGIIAQMMEAFQERKEDWTAETRDYAIKFDSWLKTALKKYQSSDEIDRLSKLEQEIGATKKILIKTIDQAIERGGKLEELMLKSNDISDRSKVFLKQAKKTNRCCVLL